VESNPGIGTRFTIFLPVHNIHKAGDSEVKSNPVEKGSGHIMCVDDEKPMAGLLEALLTDLGYDISCFTDSLQALDSFENNPGKYDLILTDHTMPKLTGLEMAKKFLSIRKDIPIILQTGYSDEVEREGVLGLGIADFIMKPVHKNELAGKIRLLLERKTEASRR
jgi:DNA-binding response OmpR family regulator